jgi:6-phosphogluconolactonase
MTNREIIVLSDLEELSRATAAKFVELTQANIKNGYSFNVALSGGSTPKRLYKLLADENEDFRRAVDWRKVNFFWGDERCVPPESDESNYRMVNEHLLKPLGISPANIHRFKSELDAESAAADYEHFLRVLFNVPGQLVPRFDVIFLGMGADGHTASLFPASDTLDETEKLVAAPFVEKILKFRLTLTPPVINNAANVIFQVAGADKADVLREVLEGERNPRRLPAQIVNPRDGKMFWFLDEAAAAQLSINRKYDNFTGRLRR